MYPASLLFLFLPCPACNILYPETLHELLAICASNESLLQYLLKEKVLLQDMACDSEDCNRKLYVKWEDEVQGNKDCVHYRCDTCRYKFSIRVGTIFHGMSRGRGGRMERILWQRVKQENY